MLRQSSPYCPACVYPRTRQGRAITHSLTPGHSAAPPQGRRHSLEVHGGHRLDKRISPGSRFVAERGSRADTVCSCVSCQAVHRLLHEYDAAVVRLLEALEQGGNSPVERGHSERIARKARRICEKTMAAIQMQLGHCDLLMDAPQGSEKRMLG